MAAALATQIAASGVGLSGASLAAPVARLLDPAPLRLLGLDADAKLDPASWSDGRGWSHGQLVHTLDGLPAATRRTFAVRLDRQVARARACIAVARVGLVGALTGVGAIALGPYIEISSRASDPRIGHELVSTGEGLILAGLVAVAIAYAWRLQLRNRLPAEIDAGIAGL